MLLHLNRCHVIQNDCVYVYTYVCVNPSRDRQFQIIVSARHDKTVRNGISDTPCNVYICKDDVNYVSVYVKLDLIGI